jgi:hypothetical protein
VELHLYSSYTSSWCGQGQVCFRYGTQFAAHLKSRAPIYGDVAKCGRAILNTKPVFIVDAVYIYNTWPIKVGECAVKQSTMGRRRSQGLPVFAVGNERRWRRAGCWLGQEVKVEREWMFTPDTHKHTHTHTHTPELDINTGKTGVAGSTMVQSGCDREDTETCSITDRTAFKFEWDYKEKL